MPFARAALLSTATRASSRSLSTTSAALSRTFPAAATALSLSLSSPTPSTPPRRTPSIPARPFHTTRHNAQPSGMGSSGIGLMPPTYFQKTASLPMNTVVRFVPQQTAWIVERMGKFNRILEPGLAILIPFLDRIAYVKSLKEAAIEIPSQSAITADNVTLELDGILYTRVFDAYKARYFLPPPPIQPFTPPIP